LFAPNFYEVASTFLLPRRLLANVSRLQLPLNAFVQGRGLVILCFRFSGQTPTILLVGKFGLKEVEDRLVIIGAILRNGVEANPLLL
jgi:hypothetical protein